MTTLRAIHNRNGEVDPFIPDHLTRAGEINYRPMHPRVAPLSPLWIIPALLLAIVAVVLGIGHHLHDNPGHAADLLAGVFIPGGGRVPCPSSAAASSSPRSIRSRAYSARHPACW